MTYSVKIKMLGSNVPAQRPAAANWMLALYSSPARCSRLLGVSTRIDVPTQEVLNIIDRRRRLASHIRVTISKPPSEQRFYNIPIQTSKTTSEMSESE
jgi:hypothetical protein